MNKTEQICLYRTSRIVYFDATSTAESDVSTNLVELMCHFEWF